jgi:hypothetical protein
MRRARARRAHAQEATGTVDSQGSVVLAAVRQLPGVSGAETGHGAGGQLDEVRVQLSPGAAWSQVEPAVRRLVSAGFAGDTEAQRVRVVPLADRTAEPAPSDPPGSAARAGRAQIRRIDLTTAGSAVTATVELSAGSRTTTGSCSGVVSGSGLPRTVATATLRALEGLLREAVRLELEHVDVSRAPAEAVALVHLSLVSAEGAQLLAGAALVRHDQSDAVVRAVLDASNRRVEALLRP